MAAILKLWYIACCSKISSGIANSGYPDLGVCPMLPELSVAAGSCLQHSLQALYIKSEIWCAASGIQEHGRGRLARPLGEPAGHGAQQLPRQPTYPNAHPGESSALIAANSMSAHWCSAKSFLAEAMHSRARDFVDQSDMIQAFCITTSETLIWLLTTTSTSAFIFEAVWSTKLGISASPFIAHHYCTVIAPLLLCFVIKL